MKMIRVIKKRSFKLKADINWNNIGKAVDIKRREYKVEKLSTGKIHTEKKGQSLNVSIPFAVTMLDFYDKEGNKISSMKDYQ